MQEGGKQVTTQSYGPGVGIPPKVVEDLMRFEELVAEAFGAPIGKIDPTDIIGWWGVRFFIGGHEFIVFQCLDGSQDLGIDVTCSWQDGHERCEDMYRILTNGFHYTGRESDDRVVRFLRRSVTNCLRRIGVKP
jgi:hypothetical protein